MSKFKFKFKFECKGGTVSLQKKMPTSTPQKGTGQQQRLGQRAAGAVAKQLPVGRIVWGPTLEVAQEQSCKCSHCQHNKR